ncbi:hypothetical protein L798_04619 [Zootermopsis nevadensis]|uniref:Uncharacterized protein n=1 Tax=Zootermopsis nevadensis TaxID=136037 RepID=A0A067QHS9_ZOONE|nr:hypothetical protein L798_04619 [Zootermopsis nevadensis]
MSTDSTQADHQAGSGTKRKFLEEMNSTRAKKSKNEDCVCTENCGLPTTIEVLTSNGQTVPLATADLQRATTKEIDLNEACTLGNENGGTEFSLLDMDSFSKQYSDTRTDSNVDFFESIAPTEHPVAEFQYENDTGDFGDDILSWLLNIKPDSSSNADEVEGGHKTGGGKDEEIACSGM